ncbi:MAG: MFS transporter [Clostridiales Family XIII bacterium]|nr:MFS transporter [Clostridiales Family XIII bacterium]
MRRDSATEGTKIGDTGKTRFSAETAILLFVAASAMVGLASGFSDSILANYFKEAYDVNAQQRGFIELPRELPGIVSILFIALLAAFGNIRSAIVAQVLCVAGLVVLGFTRPSFSVMLLFLFIYSSGVHMFMPLGDSIGLSLAKHSDMGRVMGRINSARMAFLMLAGVVTFVCFHFGWFSFDAPVLVFLVSAAAFIVVAVLLVVLYRGYNADGGETPQTRFVLRKKYLRYYLICALYGGRKQIMYVYSPWVLIDLLGFRADTISILSVIGSFIGIFFMPVVGKWIDRHGVRNVMMAEALAFIAIYVAYGFLSKWVNTHVVVLSGLAMMLVYLLNIVDRMSAQFNMVRAIYMRSIAVTPEDVTPSLTMGMGIDHVMAVIGSYACGVVWFRFGPEYVFIIAGLLSLFNLLAAWGIKPPSAQLSEKGDVL